MLRPRLFSLPDLNFLGTALVLSAIGLTLMYSATYFNDPGLSIVRKQILWMDIGLCLMTVFLFVVYHVLFDAAPLLYAAGLVPLVYLRVGGCLTATVAPR